MSCRNAALLILTLATVALVDGLTIAPARKQPSASLAAFFAKTKVELPNALAEVDPKERSELVAVLSRAAETSDLATAKTALERAKALLILARGVKHNKKGVAAASSRLLKARRQAPPPPPAAPAPAPGVVLVPPGAAAGGPAAADAAAAAAATEVINSAAADAEKAMAAAGATMDEHLTEIESLLDGLDYWAVRTPHLKSAVANYIGSYRTNMANFGAVLTTPPPPPPPASEVPSAGPIPAPAV